MLMNDYKFAHDGWKILPELAGNFMENAHAETKSHLTLLRGTLLEMDGALTPGGSWPYKANGRGKGQSWDEVHELTRGGGWYRYW